LNPDAVCPGCRSRRWRRADAHRYRRSDLDRPDDGLTAYERLRLRVLFEVWCPDADEVRLEVVLCECCGFVGYLPRPTGDDLDAKYRFLVREERRSAADVGGDIAADARRAERTFEAIVAHAHTPAGRILDFGGAEGRLLGPFHRAGWACELVDYIEDTLPGVERLGATLDDVPADSRYDGIICSHVLEHLSDPGETLRRLRELLYDDGILFVEVPVDLWGGPPIARDPVTHVNFLTPLTLEQLLARNGYRVLDRRASTGSYAGVVKDVAVAVATPGTTSALDGRAAVDEAEELLQPSLPRRLGRLWRHRVGRMTRLF
jgi:SAM-dependent methyltransferase